MRGFIVLKHDLESETISFTALACKILGPVTPVIASVIASVIAPVTIAAASRTRSAWVTLTQVVAADIHFLSVEGKQRRSYNLKVDSRSKYQIAA